MDISVISAILLFGRLVALFFLVSVLRTQWKLLKTNVYPELHSLRRILFGLVLIVALGQVIPIAIDTLSILGHGTFEWLVVYAFSNNGTAMITAVLLWAVYKISDNKNF